MSAAPVRGIANPAVAATPPGAIPPGAIPPLQLRRVALVSEPTGVASRPGDPVLYVLEKAGRVRAVRDGVLSADPVLDVSADTSTENERGLLALAFSPRDRTHAYLTRTDRSGAVVVAEYRVEDSGRFDPASVRVLLRVEKQWNDHNGGSLAFDADGLLYLGLGDGGGVGDGPKGAGDPNNNAQSLDRLLGKVLRIDPTPSEPPDVKPYTLPASNPFVANPYATEADRIARRAARPEIWAYGLRNPWRMTIDIPSGQIWIPDVGQSTWEEVNTVALSRAGANFGWKRVEGRHPYRGGTKPKGAVDPVYEYRHRSARCAVIGGAVYRGEAIPALRGMYVLGDLCGGSMTALRRTGAVWSPVDLGVGVAPLLGWGVGPDGELYATTRTGGVHRLEPRGAPPAAVAPTRTSLLPAQ